MSSVPPIQHGQSDERGNVENTISAAASVDGPAKNTSSLTSKVEIDSQTLVQPTNNSKMIVDGNNGISSTNDTRRPQPLLEQLGKIWSDRSGTTEILALKESVNEAGLAFDAASSNVTNTRRRLDDALRQWERTSGQHLQLLQRRESWTAGDAQHFADLVSKEIVSRNALQQAREDLAAAEEALTKRQLEYMNSMRRRYHEEQVWQDQWRVAGTYWTWILIVLNSFVFLVSQYFQRLREYTRMKTIELLIEEKIPHPLTVEAVVEEVKRATSSDSTVEIREQPLEGEREAVTVTAIETEAENVHQEISIVEAKSEETMPLSTLKEKEDESVLISKDDDSVEKSIRTVLSTLKEQAQIKWHVVKGNIQQAVEGLPATTTSFVEEMPKSVSEIHIPSAIVGATVTGVTLLTISILMPSRRR